eukprot:TRINITY_DN44013_c0_g1_i1.p1 TRINITY_DN44013_c0_g1~~TRINITY_DN44013_c0_g1_i1.p1  ORF type:complete len:234 (+),score=34.67 TRINITY_DN44013_c0_g1_i1:70-771(+)
MPSRKVTRQRMRANAQQKQSSSVFSESVPLACNKQMARPEDAQVPLNTTSRKSTANRENSCSAFNEEFPALVSASKVSISRQNKFHEDAPDARDEQNTPAEDAQVLSKSSSEKSISTDEGASSSCCSSLAAGGSTPPSRVEHVHAPNAPVWVGNGEKGDAAAWLLVMPKARPADSDYDATFGYVPKSPEDALLLGPYVSTKNTFLHETGLGEALELRQRPRTRSLGAVRCSFA